MGVAECDLFVVARSKPDVVVTVVPTHGGAHAVVRGCLEVHVVPVRVISQLLFLVSFILEPVLHLQDKLVNTHIEQGQVIYDLKFIVCHQSVNLLNKFVQYRTYGDLIHF